MDKKYSQATIASTVVTKENDNATEADTSRNTVSHSIHASRPSVAIKVHTAVLTAFIVD